MKKKTIGIRWQFILFVVTLLFISLIILFLFSYRISKNEIINAKSEMFQRICNDVYGFVLLQDNRVKKGEISLKEAQEEVREYVNGPKLEDGSRDASKSLMSLNLSGQEKDTYMYVWGLDSKGNVTMHPFDLEGTNAWDLNLEGVYTTRESWGNPETTGYMFRQLWQNPGEPVYTFLAYQLYYEPWDWVIGTGAREELLYKNLQKILLIRFAEVMIIIFILAVVITFFVSNKIYRPLKDLAEKTHQISNGDINVEIQTNRTDEIGELASSFNVMVEKLRELIIAVQNSIKGINDDSEHISESSQQLSESASEQASNLEQISASIEEIATHINISTKNTKSTEKVSGEAMNSVNEVISKSNDSVASNKQITDKILIINEIAAQTNILALNAAVESARAGDAGKGFAVVAAEVRKLAENSKKAADEIVNLTKIALELSESTSSIISETIPKIETTTNLVGEIAKSSEEQSGGINNVTNSIQMLNNLTQQNAAASEGLAANAEELTRRAEQLRELISFFKIN